MTIRTVGAGKQFSTIPDAIVAAQSGDTIQVDAGTYANQSVVFNKNLTLEGVGGTIKMISTGTIPNGKAILVVNGNINISNFEFSGAAVNDRNGAGIRYEGGNLTLTNTYFHHNQDGLLAASAAGSITIKNSEFAFNGDGSGQTHNLYVNHISNLTIDNSYFHDASVGHEIKSRASNTTITNSRIYDLNSTASYSVDLSNGGNALIKNNVIEQGPNSPNNIIVAYGAEGASNPGTSFTVANNTIVNDKASATGVRNWSANTAQITGNSFWGLTSAQVASGANVQSGDIFLASRPVLNTAPASGGGTVTPPPPPPPSFTPPPPTATQIVRYGAAGDDVLQGDIWGGDYIDGGAGNDSLYGYWGNDTLIGGTGNDRIYGGAGDDLIYTGPGTDYASGEYGNDTIYCGPGTNRVDGGPGTDSAVFIGNRANYTVHTISGVATVSGTEGTTSLSTVETLRFNDGTYATGGFT